MAARIAGETVYLWRAVDHEGEVLDVLVQRRHDKRAAVKLMRKLLESQGFAPAAVVTDKLRSYGAAVHNTFNLQRHLISRRTLRSFRAEAIEQWRAATAAA